MILDRFRLDDRVAIVTGAGQGIGRGIAIGLAEAGAHLALAARTASDLDEVAAVIEAGGRRALAVPTDVTDEAALENLVARTMAEFGRLDILVNNAGGTMPRPAMETSEAFMQKAFHFNVTAAFTLTKLAAEKKVLAKVVYHKLADPDHKKLRTLVHDSVLAHVNNGYCSLLEPKQISGKQFAEWITGRNPGTYVAAHYIKLIDFTFGPAWRLARIQATGQRGLVGPTDGPTWDSVQLQVVYAYPDGREAAFDIHTSWVTPDNFPGYVEQEVQFRFDNGVWNAHQRKRGVEVTIEDRTPHELKNTPNHHYNGTFIEPWGERSQRGYGLEIIERFFEEVAFVEFGGPSGERDRRLEQMRALHYSDLSADRNTVAIVQAMEALLSEHAAGRPGGIVKVNDERGGLVLYAPGSATSTVLYSDRV